MNFTIPQLAERWQCSAKTVRRLLDAGLVTHIRITRNVVLVTEEAAEEYERRRTVERRRGLERKTTTTAA